MQSLSTVPVDMLSAGPPAPSAPRTGQEDHFAAHLATAVQGKSAAPAASPSSSTSAEQATAAENQSNDTGPDNDEALDATPNGSAGAAQQQPFPGRQPEVVAAATGAAAAHRALNGSRGNEPAVIRMLDALTRTAAASETVMPAEVPAAPSEQAMPAATTANAQYIADSEGTSPLTTPMAEQKPGTSTAAGAIRWESASASQGAVASAAPTDQDGNPGTSQMQQQPAANTTSVAARVDAALQQPAANAASVAARIDAALLQQESPQPGAPLLVQNQYGQVIPIFQESEMEEPSALPANSGKAAGMATDSRSLDVNNNYIHSHLPNEVAKTAAGEKDGQQQETATAKDQQQEAVKTPEPAVNGSNTGEPPVNPKSPANTGQEHQPLLFAHNRNNGLLAGTTATSDAASIRLPSGTTVPDGAVVDQMIAHFSVNKRLETGTVNLRLNPQELGELRMEIKVEQDNIKAHIIALNPQAQEMIDRHLPRLREALEQQGLHLQQVEVTIAAHDQTGGQRFQESAGWQQPAPSPRNEAGQQVFTLDADESVDETLFSAANNLSVLA